MAQSNDSNVRGIPPFWPNHTLGATACLDPMERPIPIGDHSERKSGYREPTWTRDTGDANSNFGTGDRQRVGRGKSQQREQEQKHNETVRIRRRETDQRREKKI